MLIIKQPQIQNYLFMLDDVQLIADNIYIHT